MIALLQRVLQARVDVDDETVGAIGPGLLVLLAVEPADTPADVDGCIDRLLDGPVIGRYMQISRKHPMWCQNQYEEQNANSHIFFQSQALFHLRVRGGRAA